ICRDKSVRRDHAAGEARESGGGIKGKHRHMRLSSPRKRGPISQRSVYWARWVPAFAGTTGEVGGGFVHAYRRPRPAGVRQGRAGGADQAWRERDRRLCGAREAGPEGRSAQGGGGRSQTAGLSTRLLSQARSVGGVSRAQARSAGDGLRHAV